MNSEREIREQVQSCPHAMLTRKYFWSTLRGFTLNPKPYAGINTVWRLATNRGGEGNGLELYEFRV